MAFLKFPIWFLTQCGNFRIFLPHTFLREFNFSQLIVSKLLSTYFWDYDCIFANFDFTENLDSRRILEFPHCESSNFRTFYSLSSSFLLLTWHTPLLRPHKSFQDPELMITGLIFWMHVVKLFSFIYFSTWNQVQRFWLLQSNVEIKYKTLL